MKGVVMKSWTASSSFSKFTDPKASVRQAAAHAGRDKMIRPIMALQGRTQLNFQSHGRLFYLAVIAGRVFKLMRCLYFSKNRPSGSKCPYVCLSVCLFVCPSHFLTPFNGLFAPTSRSPMSKNFGYSESLGKSNAKKWSQIWKLFLIIGVKLLRQR